MKTATKFGLLAGALAGGWLIGEHFWELKTPGVASFAGYVGNFIYFSFIFLAIWWVREKELGGLIDFKKAMQTGVLTAAYYALMLGLITFINYKFINTDFVTNGTPEELSQSKSTSAILQRVILFIPSNILFGTVISAAISLLMRRDSK